MVSTTVVLVAVLVPIAFLLQGNTGRLFAEFALALAGAVVPVDARGPDLVAGDVRGICCAVSTPRLARAVEVDALFRPLQRAYRWLLDGLVRQPAGGAAVGRRAWVSRSFGLYRSLPQEYAPAEDRG